MINVIKQLQRTLVVIFLCMNTVSAQEIDYAKLYATLSPSVVTIHTATRQSGKTKIEASVGSGFLTEPDLIMTAAHVVRNADLILVTFKDGARIAAEVVATVINSDVALLKLKNAKEDNTLAPLGDSDSVKIGEPVFVIGSPFGIEHSLTIGHLSGKNNRSLVASGSPVQFLQTDAAINPGNSGGPMFNQHGEVIGIVSFILSQGGGFDGVGFATPINTAQDALLNSSGFWAGFEGVFLSDSIAKALNVPGSGILVQRVVAGSLAGESGLQAGTTKATIESQELLLGGDVILEINGLVCVSPHDFRKLTDATRDLNPENGYIMKVFRQGKQLTLIAATSDIQPLQR